MEAFFFTASGVVIGSVATYFGVKSKTLTDSLELIHKDINLLRTYVTNLIEKKKTD